MGSTFSNIQVHYENKIDGEFINKIINIYEEFYSKKGIKLVATNEHYDFKVVLRETAGNNWISIFDE